MSRDFFKASYSSSYASFAASSSFSREDFFAFSSALKVSFMSASCSFAEATTSSMAWVDSSPASSTASRTSSVPVSSFMAVSSETSPTVEKPSRSWTRISRRDRALPPLSVMEMPSASIAAAELFVGLTRLVIRVRRAVPAAEPLIPAFAIRERAAVTSSTE